MILCGSHSFNYYELTYVECDIMSSVCLHMNTPHCSAVLAGSLLACESPGGSTSGSDHCLLSLSHVFWSWTTQVHNNSRAHESQVWLSSFFSTFSLVSLQVCFFCSFSVSNVLSTENSERPAAVLTRRRMALAETRAWSDSLGSGANSAISSWWFGCVTELCARFPQQWIRASEVTITTILFVITFFLPHKNPCGSHCQEA